MGFIKNLFEKKGDAQKISSEVLSAGNCFFDKVSEYVKDCTHSFNSPAIKDELDNLEKKIKQQLPDSFKQFYQTHNGEKEGCKIGIFLGLCALSLDDIYNEWQTMNQYADSDDSDVLSAEPDKIQEMDFNEAWIPFAHDGSGNFLAIDFAPGRKGKPGQIINCGTDERTLYVIADNFDNLLEFVISQLEDKSLTIQSDGQNRYLEWRKHYSDIAIVEEGANENFGSVWNGFTDYWRAKIEQALERTPLSEHELSKIRRLQMMGIENFDLTPIKYFTSLGEFVASRSTSTDFSPIGKVVALKRLYLAKTNLKDIGFLEGNENLEELSMGNSQVTDISVLQKMKKLKSVSLENLAITDFSPLQQCKKIKELDLSGCKGFDVSAIASLKLKNLKLNGIPLKNMEFLKEQTKLEDLSFDMCSTGDYLAIGELESLTHITCPFEAFHTIRHLCKRKIHFTIKGEMTHEQHKLYVDYTSS